MKDLFDLQKESGQLWPDIKDHLDAKDAELSAAKDASAAQLAAQARMTNDAQSACTALKAQVDATIAKVEAAHAAGDIDALVAIAANIVKPVQQKAVEAAQAEYDAASERLKAAQEAATAA